MYVYVYNINMISETWAKCEHIICSLVRFSDESTHPGIH